MSNVDAVPVYFDTNVYGHIADRAGISESDVAALREATDSGRIRLLVSTENADELAQGIPDHPAQAIQSVRAMLTLTDLERNTLDYFWFFDPANVEMTVKVLDGCAVNWNYWIFAGGMTNVGVEWKVTRSQTNAVKNYSNPSGTAFQPVQDTAAFPCP